MTITKSKDNDNIFSSEISSLYIHTLSRGRRCRLLVVYTCSHISSWKFYFGILIANFLGGYVCASGGGGGGAVNYYRGKATLWQLKLPRIISS